MLRVLKAYYLFFNVIIIVALLLIHFVFKENSYQSSLLFYTFPLPVIILVVLFLSIFIRRKFRKYNLVLVIVLAIIWVCRSFEINFTEDIKETDLEIVFWNASHDRNFDDAFSENGSIPDILVLVEQGKYNINDFRLKYPNYYFHRSTRGIGIFSKMALFIKDEVTSKYKSNIIIFQVNDLNFYVIDVSASMDVPRTWEMDFVDSKLLIKQNAIILGDFNVPFESKLLSNIKKDFNHAFEEKGNGFRETWFWNIPLLSLDYIWVSKDLEILKTEKINTFESDHSMIKTFIRK